MGVKGNGKTKTLIDLIQKAVEVEHGYVVCIERDSALRYNLPHSVRLISASNYKLSNYDNLKGFISGLHAGNYDITHIFLDSLLKILGLELDGKMEDFLDWCEMFSEREKIKFTMTISAPIELATDGTKKYF